LVLIAARAERQKLFLTPRPAHRYGVDMEVTLGIWVNERLTGDRPLSGKVESGLPQENALFCSCAYSDRKTGIHFAEYAPGTGE